MKSSKEKEAKGKKERTKRRKRKAPEGERGSRISPPPSPFPHAQLGPSIDKSSSDTRLLLLLLHLAGIRTFGMANFLQFLLSLAFSYCWSVLVLGLGWRETGVVTPDRGSRPPLFPFLFLRFSVVLFWLRLSFFGVLFLRFKEAVVTPESWVTTPSLPIFNFGCSLYFASLSFFFWLRLSFFRSPSFASKRGS